MSQKLISTFFRKPNNNTTVKRSLSDTENVDVSNFVPEEKKLKACVGLDTNIGLEKSNEADSVSVQESINSSENSKEEMIIKSEDSTILSKKVEMNRLSAELKLLSKVRPALHPNMGISWFEALRCEFDKPYFKKLSQFLAEERSKTTPILPIPANVWTWTRECPVDEVKAVILGQDPYHNPGQAHGLSFSVPIGVPPPPSLLNMYKELEKDIDNFKKPGHGNLIGWARQGVLLLNAVLTVRCRTPNSHKDQGWEKLTDAVIKHLSSNGEGIVFLLWGAYAQKKADIVDQKKHHLLKTVHPSPLSASRGFFGCRHFSQCNQLLEKQGKKPIDWGFLPTE